MKKPTIVVLFIGILVAGCSRSVVKPDASAELRPLLYEVNLLDRSDDTFKVRLLVDGLTAENAVYQFAATAPGTYITMDMGRYVREFEALDANGYPMAVERVSTNQWQIKNPEIAREIVYTIAETWDTPVDSNKIYRMCGSSIEDDHALINGQTVFGYPTGLQSRPLRIDIKYPSDWILGTALDQDSEGFYLARNYEHVVDSPILVGELSRSELKIDSTSVEVYTYSKTGKVKSSQIMDGLEKILYAAAEFTDGLPVNRYSFLFHFEDQTVGAWEHSYSSTYTYSEDLFGILMQATLPDNAAHEFYHIVTPLNIHSEIIEEFNFVTPEPSQHLWLYEGVTEWAAHIMQLRAGLKDLNTYLNTIGQKLNITEHYPKNLSLTQLAGQAFSPGYINLHGDIYMKGALVAGLLDIRLLELSDGKMGLREVLNQLADRYGSDKAFPEEGFFSEFTAMTYPEIMDFFERYIIGNEEMPVADYYAKLGITYFPEVQDTVKTPTLGYSVGVTGSDLTVVAVIDAMEKFGLKKGDIITGLNGETVNLSNAQQAYGKIMALEVGEPYELSIRRGEESMTISCAKVTEYKTQKHVLKLNPIATEEQLALRKAWETTIQ